MKKSVIERHSWRVLVAIAAIVVLVTTIAYIAIPAECMADFDEEQVATVNNGEDKANTTSGSKKDACPADCCCKCSNESVSVITDSTQSTDQNTDTISDNGDIATEEPDYSDTDLETDKHILYDKAVDLYMSGEWDGTSMVLDGKTIELETPIGYILADGKILESQANLDTPEVIKYDDWNTSYVYVPGQGTYAIIENHLVKYLRGEEIKLPGEDLQWEGVQNTKEEVESLTIGEYNNSNYIYNYPRLIWNTTNQKMYLVSSEMNNPITFYQGGEYYLYLIPDLNSSKIEYLGKFCGTDVDPTENFRTFDLESIAHK